MIRIPSDLPSKKQIEQEMKELVDHMKDLQLPLVLSHNDLWLGNIILNKADGTMKHQL